MGLANYGPCALTDVPTLTCARDCTASNQICAGNNSCITEPTFQNVGTVTVTGLPTAVNVIRPDKNQYFMDLADIAYPPFADGAAVKLSTGGGNYGAFTLLGQGITPLESSGDGLQLARNTALNITWTPPPSVPLSGSTVWYGMDVEFKFDDEEAPGQLPTLHVKQARPYNGRAETP